MVDLSGLEKKTKSFLGMSEKNKKRLFNKVKIYKEFPNIDHSAKYIWNYFNEKGTIKKIAGEVGYIGNNLEGIPQMKTSDDGSFYPTKAVFIASVKNSTYKVIFDDSYGDKLEVTVECDIKDSKYINDLLLESILTEEIKGEKGKLVKKSVKGVNSITQIKNYNWDMVGGLGDAKKEIQQYIEWPLKNPELFKKVDTSMPKGILLIGPPGNGKTTIAKIIASQTESSFYAVSPKDINSMWVGGTEKNWGRLFDNARQDVKKGKTAIIFIDEIDGLYTARGEMDKYSRISFGQFCQEMEGISDLEKVVIIGATNKYQDLDSALVRPGRFTKKIYIGNPNEEGRKEILEIYTRKKPVSHSVDLNYIGKITEGYSGAELKELCDSAAFHSIERYCEEKEIEIKDIKGKLIKEIIIAKQDFEFALKKISDYKKDK